MSIGQGFAGIIGVVKEGSWGAVGEVTKALPFVKEDYVRDVEKHIDEVLRGTAGRGQALAGNKRFHGTIPLDLTYEDCDLLIAMALGAAGSPGANGDLYDNTYSLAEDITYSFTAAILKAVSVWEYCGNKVNTMKISGSANKPLAIEFGVAAKDIDLSSATNTAVIVAALDTEDAAAKIMFSDLEFKIAAQATALAGETEKGISDFELSLDNKLKIDQFDNRALTILEPVRDGFREIKLSFTVPRYEADTYVDWYEADTPLHAWLKFTSGNYLFDIHIPRLKIDNVQAPIEGPGLIGQKVACTCYRDPDSDSATFTLTDELEIDVTNGRSASPLA